MDQPIPTTLSEWMTRQEVAEFTKFSLEKIRLYTKTGDFKAYKLPGSRQVRYKRHEVIEAFVPCIHPQTNGMNEYRSLNQNNSTSKIK